MLGPWHEHHGAAGTRMFHSDSYIAALVHNAKCCTWQIMAHDQGEVVMHFSVFCLLHSNINGLASR